MDPRSSAVADTSRWSATVHPDPRWSRVELTTGVDGRAHGVTAYGSVTWAPGVGGTGLTDSGLRLRAGAAYGVTNYNRSEPQWRDPRITGKPQPRIGYRCRKNEPYTACRRAEVASAEALAGYQGRIGALTFKVFGGFQVIERQVTLLAPELKDRLEWDHGDPCLADIRATPHPKAVAELWWDLTRAAFVQLDATVARVAGDGPSRRAPCVEADQVSRDIDWWSASGRMRLGLRITEQISLGPEAQRSQELIDDFVAENRIGGFLRWEWPRGEVSFGGGYAGSEWGDARAYGTLNVSTKF